jgi:uncharacterized protein with PIN domain
VRLLCDEMLRGLGRWLRAAGHDVAIAGGEPDRALLDRAAAEDRTVLTRDRQLARTAPPGARVVLLGDNALDDHACAVRERLGLDWQFAPFTRCLVDNTPLRLATAEEAGRAPGNVGGPVRACPACGRLYWPGSHVRRMAARLAAWADA